MPPPNLGCEKASGAGGEGQICFHRQLLPCLLLGGALHFPQILGSNNLRKDEGRDCSIPYDSLGDRNMLMVSGETYTKAKFAFVRSSSLHLGSLQDMKWFHSVLKLPRCLSIVVTFPWQPPPVFKGSGLKASALGFESQLCHSWKSDLELITHSF